MKKKEGAKAPVSERALVQRLTRKLKAQGEALMKSRPKDVGHQGHHFIVNLEGNYISRKNFTIEELAIEMGVIRPWEELEKPVK